MNMHEACELAQAIEGNSRFAVIAIGRFVMSDELSASSKQTLAWGVSVLSLADHTDRTVIHSEADWKAFAMQRESKRPIVEPKPTIFESTTVDDEQLTLF